MQNLLEGSLVDFIIIISGAFVKSILWGLIGVFPTFLNAYYYYYYFLFFLSLYNCFTPQDKEILLHLYSFIRSYFLPLFLFF